MSFANLNLEGRVVKDPEFKNGKDGREFCTLTLVVNQQFGAQENASFYNCTGNEAVAARIRKAGVAKGRMLHINGNLTLREYTTRNGGTGMSADVGILDWHFVGARPKSDESQAPTNGANTGSSSSGTLHGEQHLEPDDDDLPL